MASPTLRGYSFIIMGGVLLLVGVGGIEYPLTLVAGTFMLGYIYFTYMLSAAYEASLASALVERIVDKEYVREGEEVGVTIRIKETTGRGVPRIIVEEKLPERVVLAKGSSRYMGFLPSSGQTIIRYTVKPYMGIHVFNPLIVVGGDLLGFFQFSMKFKARAMVKAYPAYEDMVREAFRSPIPYMGVSKSRRRGPGYDFYELRDYEPGDEVRKIVWTASARMGKLIVREDEAETRLRVMVLIDASSASWLGPPGDAPIDHIARIAASIVSSIVKRGGEAGYMIYNGLGWSSKPPATGSEQLDSLLYNLASLTPPRHRGVYRLGEAVEEASLYAGRGLLFMLMGWMTLRRYEASKVVSSIRGAWGRTVLAIVVPGEASNDPVIEAARRLEAWWFRRNTRIFVEGGIIPVIARGWESYPAVLSSIGRLVEAYAAG